MKAASMAMLMGVLISCHAFAQAQQAPRAGLLLALSACEQGGCKDDITTLWIVREGNSVRLRASGHGLLIPRKTGFWWAGIFHGFAGNDEQTAAAGDNSTADQAATPARPGVALLQPTQLWAVPAGERPTLMRYAQASLQEKYEGVQSQTVTITFAATDYLSISYSYELRADVNAASEDVIVRLDRWTTETPPQLPTFQLSGPDYERESKRCEARLIRQGGDFSDRGFLDTASRFWQIVRRPTSWQLVQNFRSGHGDSNSCMLPGSLIRTVVGFDRVTFPWSAIKDRMPLAETALQSPDGGLLLVADYGGVMRAFFPQGASLGPEIAHFNLPHGRMIMAQWSTRDFVQQWDAQVTKLLREGPPRPEWRDAPNGPGAAGTEPDGNVAAGLAAW